MIEDIWGEMAWFDLSFTQGTAGSVFCFVQAMHNLILKNILVDFLIFVAIFSIISGVTKFHSRQRISLEINLGGTNVFLCIMSLYIP